MAADAPAGGASAPVAAPADLQELGYVRGAYGLRGWAWIQPHSPTADGLLASRRWWLSPPPARVPVALEVSGVRRHGGAVVAKWRGCDTPEAAEALRGAAVAVSRGDFPPPAEGEFYWVDLIGAQVVNRAGEDLGVVKGLRANGVHDLLEVQGEGGEPFLVPVVDAYLDGVDLARRLVHVDWERSWSS